MPTRKRPIRELGSVGQREERYNHSYGRLRNKEKMGYAENVDVSEYTDTHFIFEILYTEYSPIMPVE